MRYLSEHHPSYELRGAEVRVKRGPNAVDCDYHECLDPWGLPYIIFPGDTFAYVNTGLRFCSRHFTPDHIIERTK